MVQRIFLVFQHLGEMHSITWNLKESITGGPCWPLSPGSPAVPLLPFIPSWPGSP